MTHGWRKLIGAFLLVALVVIYALVAVTVASARLAESTALVHFTYFLVTGLLWVLPAMGLIKWMAGPKRRD
ncbi:MAG: DUF2842 domain-containing protein [Phyllobacteriaceae bacterium]|nr:DUF2842 domain-containing protein [Phyllobacteriaceae bacterium]